MVFNAAALLAPGFYAMWVGVFFWLPALGPASLAFAIGMILGLVVIIGAVLIFLKDGSIGGTLVLLGIVLGLGIGGGFLIGFVLGIVGGIAGATSDSGRHNRPIFQSNSALMFCRECGARIARQSKYCPECGAKFDDSYTRTY